MHQVDAKARCKATIKRKVEVEEKKTKPRKLVSKPIVIIDSPKVVESTPILAIEKPKDMENEVLTEPTSNEATS